MPSKIDELQAAHEAAVTALAAAKELQSRMLETQTVLIRRQRESAETAAGIRSESVEALLAGKEPNVGKFAHMETKRRLIDDALGEIGRRIREGLATVSDCAGYERGAFADLQRGLADEEEVRAIAALATVRPDLGEGGALEFHGMQFQRRRDLAAEADLESVRLHEQAQRTRAEHKRADAA